jgi:hypothetical protein
VIGGYKVSKVLIYVTFNYEIAKYLMNAYITLLPVDLFKVDGRNPHAYYLGCKLFYHYGLNHNQRIYTNDIISVQSLLRYCPNFPYTEGEAIKELRSRHYQRDVIEPFQNALNLLVDMGILEDWKFCHAKKKPISITESVIDETYELDGTIGRESLNYESFLKLYITFKPAGYPDANHSSSAKKHS